VFYASCIYYVNKVLRLLAKWLLVCHRSDNLAIEWLLNHNSYNPIMPCMFCMLNYMLCQSLWKNI